MKCKLRRPFKNNYYYDYDSEALVLTEVTKKTNRHDEKPRLSSTTELIVYGFPLFQFCVFPWYFKTLHECYWTETCQAV